MSDRDAARRRRSAQNRREREARAARVERARSSSPASTSPPASTGKRSSGSSGRRPAAGRTAARGQWWTDSASPKPGSRMVLLSVLLAAVATVMLYFLPIVPIREDVGGRTVDRTASLADEAGAKVLPYLIVPIVVAASAWFAGRWSGRRRRRVTVVAAVTQWLWIMLAGPLGLLYLVSAIALAVGAWQAVQAGRRDPAGDGDGEVDVDEPDDAPDGSDDELDDELDEDDEGPDEPRPSPWSRLLGRRP